MEWGMPMSDEQKDRAVYEDDIARFFDQVALRLGDQDEGIQQMCRLLVETTLAFRDQLRHSRGETLTVGETRDALDTFMEVMKTHRIPEKLPPHVHGLVIMWLEEIKTKVHH